MKLWTFRPALTVGSVALPLKGDGTLVARPGRRAHKSTTLARRPKGSPAIVWPLGGGGGTHGRCAGLPPKAADWLRIGLRRSGMARSYDPQHLWQPRPYGQQPDAGGSGAACWPALDSSRVAVQRAGAQAQCDGRMVVNDPRYSFVEDWNDNGRCLIEMDATLFEVRRLDKSPPWPKEFRAYYGGGKAIARAGSFLSLLKRLERWPLS